MRVSLLHYGHALGAAAVLAPLLGLFAPLLIAPLAILTILAALSICIKRQQPFPSFYDPFLLSIFGLLAWSGITLLWAINSESGLQKGLSLAALMVPFAYLLTRMRLNDQPERRLLRRAIYIGAALGAGLALFEITTGGIINMEVLQKGASKSYYTEVINRAPAVLLVFTWLAVLATPKYRWPILAVGAVIGYMLPSESALLAYVVGVMVYTAALIVPRIARILLPAVMAGTILLAPLLFSAVDKPVRTIAGENNPSIVHRIEIWRFAVDRIRERPWFGWGFNGSRAVPGGDERYLVKNATGVVIGEGDRLPLHPHNGALQIWLELGAVGAVLAAILAGLIGYRTIARAEAGALTTTVFLIWLLSFGAWQSWWVCTIFLTVLLASPFCHIRDEDMSC